MTVNWISLDSSNAIFFLIYGIVLNGTFCIVERASVSTIRSESPIGGRFNKQFLSTGRNENPRRLESRYNDLHFGNNRNPSS